MDDTRTATREELVAALGEVRTLMEHAHNGYHRGKDSIMFDVSQWRRVKKVVAAALSQAEEVSRMSDRVEEALTRLTPFLCIAYGETQACHSEKLCNKEKGGYCDKRRVMDDVATIRTHVATLTVEKKEAEAALRLACEWTYRHCDVFPRGASGPEGAPAFWLAKAHATVLTPKEHAPETCETRCPCGAGEGETHTVGCVTHIRNSCPPPHARV